MNDIELVTVIKDIDRELKYEHKLIYENYKNLEVNCNHYDFDVIFRKQQINEKGEWIDRFIYKNKFRHIKNNKEFVRYLKCLNSVRKQYLYYNEYKETLNAYTKMDSYKYTAEQYLEKLEVLNDKYNNIKVQANKLLEKYRKKLVRVNGINKICNKLYDESWISIIWMSLLWISWIPLGIVLSLLINSEAGLFLFMLFNLIVGIITNCLTTKIEFEEMK